jgi:hypothetical protein
MDVYTFNKYSSVYFVSICYIISKKNGLYYKIKMIHIVSNDTMYLKFSNKNNLYFIYSINKMERYIVNTSLCGGMFILEASTTGNTGSWIPMVAQTANNKFLAREGLCTVAGQTGITNNQNASPFVNKIFTITPARLQYTWPTILTNPVIPSALSLNTKTSNCTIIVSGGNASDNTTDDFNVSLVPISVSSPYWTPGTTRFNCDVKNYAAGTLTFDATPTVTGKCKIAVFTRSGEGTGVLGTPLLSSTEYYIPRTFTFSGTLRKDIAGTLSISITVPSGLSSGTEKIKVYYSASNSDSNPLLCSNDAGTIINSSGQSNVSCTIAAVGPLYLYIKLSDDSFTNLNVSSTTITVIDLPSMKLPATGTITAIGTINADGSWTVTVGSYSGVIIDRVYSSNFTLVVLWSVQGGENDYKYSQHAMITNPSAVTSNYYANNFDYYDAGLLIQNFPGYTVGLYHYNSSYGAHTPHTVWNNTYYKYERTGNTITLSYSHTNGSWTLHKTSTVNTNDKIICVIGTAAGTSTTKTASVISST